MTDYFSHIYNTYEGGYIHEGAVDMMTYAWRQEKYIGDHLRWQETLWLDYISHTGIGPNHIA